MPKLRDTSTAWAHIHFAPSIPRWSDPTPLDSTGPTEQSQAALAQVLRKALEAHKDLDYVVAVSLPHFPQGIVGFGAGPEARAFLFSRICRAYPINDVHDISTWARSNKGLHLVHDLRDHMNVRPVNRHYQLPREMMCQLWPIVNQFADREAPQSTTSEGSVDECSSNKLSIIRTPLPLYLLLIHAIDEGVIDAFNVLKRQPGSQWDCLRYRDPRVAVPVSGVDGRTTLPLLPLVQWNLVGLVSTAHEQVTPRQDTFAIPSYNYSWMFSGLRIGDVDAMLRFRDEGDGWLQAVWRKARPGFVHTVLRIAWKDPQTFKDSLGPTIRALVDLHRQVKLFRTGRQRC